MTKIECADCGPRLCTGYRVRRGSVKVLLCDECAEREIRVQTRHEVNSPLWHMNPGTAVGDQRRRFLKTLTDHRKQAKRADAA